MFLVLCCCGQCCYLHACRSICLSPYFNSWVYPSCRIVESCNSLINSLKNCQPFPRWLSFDMPTNNVWEFHFFVPLPTFAIFLLCVCVWTQISNSQFSYFRRFQDLFYILHGLSFIITLLIHSIHIMKYFMDMFLPKVWIPGNVHESQRVKFRNIFKQS